MASYDTLEVEPGIVATVRLNRPAVSNALNTRMGEELVEWFERLAMESGETRCVVLTGAGDKAFCAGRDLKERRGMTDEAWRRQHVIFERMVRALLDCPIPIIGAVNGAAYGGGCEIAACCDFLYAAEHARFALTEVTLGILPGGGGTQTLARAVGERRAKELILTGRPFSAAQAQEWGLVNAVFPQPSLFPEVLTTAEWIAANAPISIRQAKQSIQPRAADVAARRPGIRDRGLQPHRAHRGPARGRAGISTNVACRPSKDADQQAACGRACWPACLTRRATSLGRIRVGESFIIAIKFPLGVAVACAMILSAPAAWADQDTLRISRTTTMAYLPVTVMGREKLLEKQAAKQDITDLKVSFVNFSGPGPQIDAMLSGNVDIVAVGSTALVTLWAKTEGTPLEVRGIADGAKHKVSKRPVNPGPHRR